MVKYKIGNISINNYIEYKALSADATDILVGNSKVYCVGRNLNAVTIYNKNPDGTLGSLIATRNWVSDDSLITDICVNGSSVPYSYTVFVQDEKDYLVGWGTNTRILVWEIQANGSVAAGKRVTYTGQERSINSYSRAGWDGEDHIWFWDSSSLRIYKWSLVTRGVAEYVVTTNTNASMTSSFTGAGIVVDSEFIYWGSGANSGGPQIGAFRLDNGTHIGVITSVQMQSLDNPVGTSQSMPAASTMQISPLHPDIAYVIGTSVNGVYVVSINSNLGRLGFDAKPSIVTDFLQGVEYYATDEVELAWKSLQLLPQYLIPEYATVTATTSGKGGTTYEDGKLFRAVIKKVDVVTDIEIGV